MADLDPVIHAQARLRVVSALSAMPNNASVTFPRLQKLLDMTAGNLSTHLRKLEDAGYVTQTKAFEGRSPVTYVELTSAGQAAFDTYTAQLQALLEGTATGPHNT